ncbi:hypothetical protein PV569_34060 [Streptomyces scabiei]|nr:hypothetical protein [Streptomyces scabiei]
MTDDRDEGERVLQILEPLLNACTALVVGSRTNLRHRGDGLRVTYEVLCLPGSTTIRVDRVDADQEVTVERADEPERRSRQRALPRGRRA